MLLAAKCGQPKVVKYQEAASADLARRAVEILIDHVKTNSD